MDFKAESEPRGEGLRLMGCAQGAAAVVRRAALWSVPLRMLMPYASGWRELWAAAVETPGWLRRRDSQPTTSVSTRQMSRRTHSWHADRNNAWTADCAIMEAHGGGEDEPRTSWVPRVWRTTEEGCAAALAVRWCTSCKACAVGRAVSGSAGVGGQAASSATLDATGVRLSTDGPWAHCARHEMRYVTLGDSA